MSSIASAPPSPALPLKGGERREFNSWDALKVIALLLMFVDHAGAFFFIHQGWMRAVGRGSAPIFLFLAGYAASYRFSQELFILGCLMLLSNVLMGEYFHPLCILFTILISRAALAFMDKRGIEIGRPFDWFVVLSIFVLLTCFVVQYGTLGLLFSISAYMQKRSQRYAVRTQRLFLAGSLAVHAGTFILLFDMAFSDVLVMIPVLYFDYWLLSRFTVRPVDTARIPAPLLTLMTLASHYSGYIYALHLIAISWITGYAL